VKKNFWENTRSLLFAVGIALALRWGVAEAYVIPSGSMLPTLLIHDHIFINKLIYGIRLPFSKTWIVKFREPQKGEVIVFKSPVENGVFLIKRVIAVAGDKIRYVDKKLYINDKLVETTVPLSSWDFDFVRNSELEEQKDQHERLTENLNGHEHTVLHLNGRMEQEQAPFVVPAGSLFMMGDHRDNSFDSRYWGVAPEENVLGKAMFVWLSCEEALPFVNVGCNPLTIRWTRFFHFIN
jgi:signal peptidase I